MRSKGYRRRTRSLFSKGQKEHGAPRVTKIIQQFKVGDLVDIKVDPSVVKGMPHKYYHGKTGKVYNVNRRAVGVILYRCVGYKFIERHINVRVEHLTLSRSGEDARNRYNAHTKKLAECKAGGTKCVVEKRQPVGARGAIEVSLKNNTPIEVKEQKFYAVY